MNIHITNTYNMNQKCHTTTHRKTMVLVAHLKISIHMQRKNITV